MPVQSQTALVISWTSLLIQRTSLVTEVTRLIIEVTRLIGVMTNNVRHKGLLASLSGKLVRGLGILLPCRGILVIQETSLIK
jgi:hypothetical protein